MEGRTVKIGDRVRYVTFDNDADKESGFYPPVGTAGTVTETNNNGCGVLVKWDYGTKGSGEWWCGIEDVVLNEQYYDASVDKIARFFEENETNWQALMNCWIENGRSNSLRVLLLEAMK